MMTEPFASALVWSMPSPLELVAVPPFAVVVVQTPTSMESTKESATMTCVAPVCSSPKGEMTAQRLESGSDTALNWSP